MSTDFDVIVIGAGPGGETAASRLHAGGRRVALIEQELIGGECAYWACIPSKTLLRPPEARAEAAHAAGLSTPAQNWAALRDYRDYMIRHLDDTEQVTGYEKQGVTVIKATAALVGRDPWRVRAGGRELTAEHVVIATGSDAIHPPIEGLDEVSVWTNREATTLREIPERIVMIGGSAVGIELGQFLARMGARVTLIQRGDRLLDREDPRVGDIVATHLRADGIDVRLGRQATAARRDGADTVIDLDDGTTVRTDVVVLGTGRRPRTHGLGLETVGVTPDPRGALEVDEHCRVTAGLWALGDVTGVALFTHVAMYQGRVVADNILGTPRQTTYSGIPRVVFAQPEIAAVGLTTDQARQRGLDIATTELDLADSIARPWTYETDPDGTLGLIADRTQRTLIGAWAIAPQAGEWIHTAALAIRAQISIDTLLDGVAQFPTYTEAYLAALEQLAI
ncbi:MULTISPECIES: dihydrolipoyl dehydrogenase family protein [Actinomycetes]|uniref:Pyruvate/2-oxoglutarate dehydrogenase complex, dihydrolipoamide dehydrogenase component n=8 Tax=Actinomycetes TaxID=1760 RepID=I4BSM1_MYCCN|nr:MULTISPECIES: NAD(P)/FAD-dependent oxidoreductase [Actinomycetes]ORB82329.1 pyridine nucleotide-disulfide oxidoreductase [Mycobacterium persicum]VEG41103.1 pyruvate/2-oxoglutarate dehydrogenase complex, dihydrolipoamide dehydrogenase component [Mycolicibacterium flavescens]AFM20160.1 pyruvate/2-oxoglutarate dehydrogenase complex, dihydrolipoamide dehydrogenase component [Mycolicibacterium chubuense NBB4]AFM20278.1 pyruvate/2-oxoglutarate dehydrogenase complex, dihydrolipoamide dehydrogenase 